MLNCCGVGIAWVAQACVVVLSAMANMQGKEPLGHAFVDREGVGVSQQACC